VIEVLVHDHREVEELFAKFEATSDPEARQDISEAVITELVRHSVAEEQYVYPTARKVLADGDQIAEHEIAEHAEAERDMKAIEALDPADPEFERLFLKLAAEIRHHVQDEETDLFPRLRAACRRRSWSAPSSRCSASSPPSSSGSRRTRRRASSDTEPCTAERTASRLES